MEPKRLFKKAVRDLEGPYTLVLNGSKPSGAVSGVYPQDFNLKKYPREQPIVPVRGAYNQTTGEPIAEGAYPFSTGPQFRRRFPQVEGQLTLPTGPVNAILRVLR